MNLGLRLPLLAALCLADAHAQSGANSKDASSFDATPDGYLDFDELRQMHTYLLSNMPADGDRDGRLGSTEVAAYAKKFDAALQAAMDDYEPDVRLPVDVANRRHFSEPLTSLFGGLDEAARARAKARNEDRPFNGPLMLRRTASDISLMDLGGNKDAQAQAFKAADPALFSYSRNFETKGDTWLARGALLYPFILDARWAASASVSFDRTDNEDDPSKVTSQITPRVSLERHLPMSLLDSYFRVHGAYATDFDGDSGVVSAEFEWEPVTEHLWGGVSRDVPLLNDWLEARFRPVLHAEFGEVLSAGSNPALTKDDGFVRVGPDLRIDVFPKSPSLDGMSLFARYRNYVETTGNLSDVEAFEVGLKHQLDSTGHVLIEINYRHGETPLLSNRTDQLIVALGVKF